MQNKNIYLKNEILENKELSANAISVYVALRSIYAEGRTEYYINSDLLYYELYHSGTVNRYAKENIKEGLQELLEAKVITTITKISKDGSILDLSNLYIEQGEFYTIIKQDEVYKIMNISKGKEDNFKVLRYFVILMKTIDCRVKNKQGNTYVGYMSKEYLSKASGISDKSVITYNKILEDNEIIYIYHHNKIISSGNDNISAMPNHYGRYKDKNDIKAYAEEYERIETEMCDRIKKENKKIKTKKAKENQDKKQQEESRYGIAIGTKKESTKVETSSYDFDEDDVEF